MPEKLKSLADVLGVPDDERPADALDPYVEPTSVRDFAQSILKSAEYRMSIMRRVALLELPAAVEVLLHHYAWGKPVDRIEHTGKDGAPMETITEVRRTVIKAQDDPREFDEPRPPTPTTRTH